MDFKGTKNKLVVISDFEYFRIDEKVHGNQLKRLARVMKSGYSLNECKANAVLFSCATEMLDLLGYISEALAMKGYSDFLILLDEIDALREKATTI